MIPYCNLHTHTTYCDGKSSPREIVQAALSQGLSTLGFSGHSYTAFDPSYCMSKESTGAYIAEIRSLQAEFQGRLNICLGVEQDYFAESAEYDYDFTIGAVHYVKKDGRYWDVDESAEKICSTVKQCYGGDFYAYARDYYSLVADLPRRTGCQIVAHLDLLTKFNEKSPFFNEEDPRYLQAAFPAIAAICGTGAFFEVNTGAISRGYRSLPYPSVPLLKEIRRQDGKIILGSDSHHADTLTFAFTEALDLVRSCGFRNLMVRTSLGFEEMPI